MLHILIGGYFGAGNIGDEAILDCMLKDFREVRPDIRFIVTSWNPVQTKKRFNVQAIHWNDLPALIDAGNKSNLIILGGGGLFQDYWGIDTTTYLRKSFRDITAYGSLPLLANLLGIPCMIYAVGLGPFKSPEALRHTLFAFENATVGTLRDKDSLELIRASEFFDENLYPYLQVTADPVFTLHTNAIDDELADKLFNKYHLDSQKSQVAVVLRHWDLDGSGIGWLENIADGLNKFLIENENFSAIILSFQNNKQSAITNDGAIYTIFRKLILKNRYCLIREQLTPQIAQSIFKRCTIVLGMRLHSLIMGINSNTPVVGISYDPKVSSLMKSAGLEEYCCTRFPPSPEEIATKLKLAFLNRDQLRNKLDLFQNSSTILAKKNTKLAIDLISESPQTPRKFAQQFPIEQVKIINNLDNLLENSASKISELTKNLDSTQAEVEYVSRKNNKLNNALSSAQTKLKKLTKDQNNLESKLKIALNEKIISQKYLDQALKELEEKINENQNYQIQIRMLNKDLKLIKDETIDIRSQLDRIYSGKFWKFASFYYLWMNKFKDIFRSGISNKSDNPLKPISNGSDSLQSIIQKLNSCEIKGVFVVTSTVPFDELYNQRIINFSKYLGNNGYGVIFVAWRWTSQSDDLWDQVEVFENVFQIPIDKFLNQQNFMKEIRHSKKYFVIEFPHPDLYSVGLKLRKHNFSLIYEIIDDWESFHQSGQAIWFNQEIERSLVLNANYLTAVSPPLVEKFLDIRSDINLIPNGYYPNLLGKNNSNISNSNISSKEIRIGYFGHLTDSWFDWQFLYRLLDLSEETGINLKIHIIGYGEPESLNLEKHKGNLLLHGRVEPSMLHQYVKNWDIAMIPFKTGKLAEAVDPIKLYEYLFFGLPVIVKGITHLENHPFVKLISTEMEFLEAIPLMKRLAQTRNTNNDLTKFVRETTWNDRFNQFLKILENEPWMFL